LYCLTYGLHLGAPEIQVFDRSVSFGRQNRSTKQTDSKKARKTAEDWEKVDRMARRGVLVEAQARQFLNEILQRATGDRLQAHSCREWVKRQTGNNCAKTMLNYAQVTRDFLECLGNVRSCLFALSAFRISGHFAGHLRQSISCFIRP
jgi:hypothetical protein